MKTPCVLNLVAVLFACPCTFAAMIGVTSSGDSGPGTLRQALADANNGDTIAFNLNLPEIISLTSAELVIDKNITIIGPNAQLLTVARAQGASNFRIFHITPGHTITIQGLTITNGYINFGFVAGGGIYNDHSNLTVNKCIITGNSAHTQGGFSGGGIGNNAIARVAAPNKNRFMLYLRFPKSRIAIAAGNNVSKQLSGSAFAIISATQLASALQNQLSAYPALLLS